MIGRTQRLRNRLMLAFASFALGVAALFALYAAVFVYTVEDTFFNTMLVQEGQLQLQHFAEHRGWATPHSDFMRVHVDVGSLPDGIGKELAAAPRRTEFPGIDGRHYHLRVLRPPAPAAPAWLVAEVSGQLVVRPMREEMVRLLAWSSAAIVALALIVAGWLARRTARPLGELATLVGSMNPARLPEHFAHRYANDEVGAVARGLEELMDRIRAFIAREQAFTRDASHELRTPLTVIRSAGERLATEAQLSDAGRTQLDHVRQSIRQLEQTVTILLELAREGRGPASTSIAVLPALELAVIDQSSLLEGKDVHVAVRVPRATRVTMPDSVLHILLSNLVGNAFAHTVAGRVVIDVRDRRLRISNSEGWDPAVREDPHRAFHKGKDSAGFGLGLAIVQRLCDRYGIDLQIGREAHATIASIAVDDPGNTDVGERDRA
ncbi:MAG: HAMP domain-containing sensor histidine kinase [Dokdonella sp.]